LQQLAEDRILDAAALLAAGRWAGAYYLAGYAVECGLKACVMAYVERTGVIFEDKKYGEKCWTHDFVALVKLAVLEDALEADTRANRILAGNWKDVKDWNETSRYKQKSQAEAEELYASISHVPDGVLQWIRRRW
jgi:hypothetical protein